MNKLTAD